MKGRILTSVLSLTLALQCTVISVNARPEDEIALEAVSEETAELMGTSGTCGDNLTWTLDDSGTLTISGEGEMEDFSSPPWYSSADSIKKILIDKGITSINNSVFFDCENLAEINVDEENSKYASENGILFDKDKMTLVSFPKSKSGTYIIPDSVTSIDEDAFSYCSSLTSVTIPDSVISIGDGAFSDCTVLTDITIGNSVTSIGPGAFEDTGYYNDEHNWENGILYIGEYLVNAKEIYSGYIKDGTKLIADSAFQYCRNLSYIIIPESVVIIGVSAFDGCEELTEVTIPDSVTSIGTSAFSNCQSLTNLTIGSNVTSIGDSAFSGCESLISVTIPDSVTSIEERVFDSCKSLTSVTIPESVTGIGSYAFLYCSSLSAVVIPDSVESIDFGAFACCSALTDITIGDNVTWIGGNVFADTGYYNDESNWENGVLYINNCLIDAKKSISGEYAIKEGTKVIPENAFYGCRELTSIIIPDGVINIGANAFCECSSLSSVTIPGSVEKILKNAFCTVSIADVYISDLRAWCNISFSDGTANPLKNGTRLHLNNEQVTELVIPNGVTKIADYAFSNFSRLESVTIPDSVTSIGESAFNGCKSLTSVTIPDSVTSIGDDVFSGCKGLQNIVISDNVTSIGESAFSECEALASVTVPACATRIGEYAFYGCRNLTSVTIPDSVTNIGGWAFYLCNLKDVYISDVGAWCNISFGDNCANPLTYGCNLYLNGELITELVIPDGVTTIAKDAFSNCKTITSVTIPDSVTSIGESAFSDCTALTDITIGNGVTSIGVCAFYRCKSLTSVTIPDSIEIIGASAFQGCENLTGITIGKGITTINSSAFYNSGYYKDENNWENGVLYIGNYLISANSISGEYTIKDGTRVIANNAFSYCKGLTGITIPESIISIGNGAFGNCSGLTSVYISDISKWCSILFGDIDANPLSKGDKLYLNNEPVTELVIPDGVTNISSYAFYMCGGLESAVIPESVKIIGEWTFGYCDALKSITIPDSVKNIGEYAFYGCWSLEDLKAGNSGLKAFEFSDCRALSNVEIFEGVTDISEQLFYNCANLNSITIPSSIVNIGGGAFNGCDGLAKIYISDIEAWCNILFDGYAANPLIHGGELYLNGELVTDLVIPDSITSISDSLFAYCNSLTSVTIPDSVTSIGAGAFSGCVNLTSVTISDSVTNVGIYAFRNTGYYNNESNWEDGVLYIGNHLITANSTACSGEYAIKDGTRVIADEAFAWCKNLTSVTIPDGVISIGEAAFDSCYSLKQAAIPNGVVNIRNNTFHECALTSITIPDSVKSIGEAAFLRCDFTSVIIPKNVTSIGEEAFYECSNLTSVTIGKNVKDIGDGAFRYCYNLTDVYYYGTDEKWKKINIGWNNNNLKNAKMHFLDVIDDDTDILPLLPIVAKTINSTISVAVEDAYEDSIAYAAFYDADGKFIAVSSTKLDSNGNADISVIDGAVSAGVMVWVGDMQPSTAVAEVEF